MANKAIDPSAAALGAIGLVTELIGALGRQGVLDMKQVAEIYSVVEKRLPRGEHEGLHELLSAQRDLADRFSSEA